MERASRIGFIKVRVLWLDAISIIKQVPITTLNELSLTLI